MSFGSPAIDYVEQNLDLNRFLVQHPVATYFVKMEGDAMKDAGILEGDILVIDRSLPLENNKIIIAEVDGELKIRRYRRSNGQICLMPENFKHKPLFFKEDTAFTLWGTVTSVIRKV